MIILPLHCATLAASKPAQNTIYTRVHKYFSPRIAQSRPANLFAMLMQIANSPARRDFSSISALQGKIFAKTLLYTFFL